MAKKKAPSSPKPVEVTGLARFLAKATIFLYKYFPSVAKFFGRGKVPAALTALPQTEKATVPKLPQVNLLPPRLAFEELRRSTRRGFIIIAMGAAAIVGMLLFAQSSSIGLANRSLTAAQAQVSQALARANEYRPIGDYFDALQNRLDLAAQKTGSQLDYTRLINAAARSVAGNGTLTAVSTKPLALAPGQAADPNVLSQQCGPVNNPFTPTTAQIVGCLTFAGTSADRGQISQIIRELQAYPFLDNVFVTPGALNANGQVPFSGSATITIGAVGTSAGGN